MAGNSIFEVLLLIGRPAAGKSEVLQHLKKTKLSERIKNYHIGEIDVIDDFPMLWTWREEDNILSKKFNKQRLHTDEKGYFIYPYLWNLLIERIGLDYQKRIRDDEDYHQHTTTIIEFSRGSEHGGYSQAFEHLTDEITARAGMVYVQVSFEESMRKNRRRFNPQRPDSILEHGLQDEKIRRLYRDDDWLALIENSPDYINLNERMVPYTVLENEDDVTTRGGDLLSRRLADTLSRLWRLSNPGNTTADEQ
jgi:hypothetical protein